MTIKGARGIARFNSYNPIRGICACDVDYIIKSKDPRVDLIIIEGKNRREKLRPSQMEILATIDRVAGGRILCFIARTLTIESWDERDPDKWDNIELVRIVAHDETQERNGYFKTETWTMSPNDTRIMFSGHIPYPEKIIISEPEIIIVTSHER